MKRISILFVILALATAAFQTGCKKEETPTLTLVSLMAGDIDLAGVTAATDVPEDSAIVAVFSSDLDPSTVNKTNFAITKSEDGSAVAYTVSVSGATVTMTPDNGWDGGTQFEISLSSSIKGTNGAFYKGNVLSFRTSGIFVPQKDKEVLFLSFDNQTAVDEAGDHTVTTVSTLNFTEDRRGTQNAAAYFDGEGNLVEVAADADLISPSITISFWFNSAIEDYDGGNGTGLPQTRFMFGLGVEKGYFLEIGRRSNDPQSDGFNEIFLKFATDHVNIGNNAASVPKATAWTEVNSQISLGYEAGVSSGWSFAIDQLSSDPPNRDYIRQQVMNNWTHFVMTFDAAAQTKTIYVNGQKWAAFTWIPSGTDWLMSDLSLKTENNDGSPITGIEGSLAIGFAGSSTNEGTGWANYTNTLSAAPESKKFFKGGIDQFRIFSVALNDTEVQTLYDNEK